jgi:hypothetical protein
MVELNKFGWRMLFTLFFGKNSTARRQERQVADLNNRRKHPLFAVSGEALGAFDFD